MIKALYIMLLLIVIIVCISKHALIEKYDSCSEDLFGRSLNDRIGKTCYYSERSDCRNLMTELGLSFSVNDMTADQSDVHVNQLKNNLYYQSGYDKPLGINECVLPESILSTYNIDKNNCRLQYGALVQDLNKNPEIKGVKWTEPNGCVISEKQLRDKQNFDMIIGMMKMIDDSNKIASRKSIQDNTNNNNTATDLAKPNQTAAEKETQANVILTTNYTQQTVQKKAINQANLAAINSYINTTSVNKELTDNLSKIRSIITDKIVGIRFDVYKGFYDGKSGFFGENAYPIYSDFAASISDIFINFPFIDNLDSYTLSIYGIYVPLKSVPLPKVQWEFQLRSDDYAHMWITPGENTDDISSKDVPFKNITLSKAHIEKRNGRSSYIVTTGLQQPIFNIKIICGSKQKRNPVVTNGIGLGVTVTVNGTASYELGTDSDVKLSEIRSLYAYPKKGLLCKVFKGYYNDNKEFFNRSLPMVTTKVTELNLMYPKMWNPNFGITKGAIFTDDESKKYDAQYDDLTRFQYTTGIDEKGNPTSASVYPFQWQHWDAEGSRSLEVTGWFKPKYAGSYIFYLTSDDGSQFYIGDNVLYNNGLHGPIMKSITYNVTQDAIGKTVYVVIHQGDNLGGNSLVFSYRRPNSVVTIYQLEEEFIH